MPVDRAKKNQSNYWRSRGGSGKKGSNTKTSTNLMNKTIPTQATIILKKRQF
jgi:hypothetical protein